MGRGPSAAGPPPIECRWKGGARVPCNRCLGAASSAHPCSAHRCWLANQRARHNRPNAVASRLFRLAARFPKDFMILLMVACKPAAVLLCVGGLARPSAVDKAAAAVRGANFQMFTPI